MPKPLLDRCRPDSIHEFRHASEKRFLDGHALASRGRRTAAIYIWGYVAEMTLKAAYFRLIGFPSKRQITPADLRGARTNAALLGFSWIGNLHDLESWANLLVATRAAIPGLMYPIPAYGSEIVNKATRIQRHWSETLRYHKNTAYFYEVNQVRSDAEWLLLNRSAL